MEKETIVIKDRSMVPFLYWAIAIGVLIAKLLGYTSMSWFWATLMLYLPIAVSAIVCLIIFLIISFFILAVIIGIIVCAIAFLIFCLIKLLFKK